MPATPSLARALKEKARALGFDRVGFCDATPPEETRHFERWLSAGMHGAMAFMEKRRAPRADPRLVLEGARSLVVAALSYAAPGSEPARAPAAAPAVSPGDPPRGIVSRYALGDDYHRVLGERLEALADLIESSAPGHRALVYVDTGPILERMWAARAGIGWVGRNSLILNKEMGSFFFLGVVLTTLPLPPDAPAFDQCGACRLCIEACPTEAIVEPRLVDSRRCLSYHTIELRGPLPAEHREALGDRVFGCDDCQDVCPWNRRDGAPAPPAGSPGFPPRAASTAPSLIELLAMTRDQYLDRFRGSAIKRATWRGLRRNAAAALGNSAGGPGELAALEAVARDESDDPVVREQARWSARRLARREETG